MISFYLWHTAESFPSPLYDRLNSTLCIKSNDSPSRYLHASYVIKRETLKMLDRESIVTSASI